MLIASVLVQDIGGRIIRRTDSQLADDLVTTDNRIQVTVWICICKSLDVCWTYTRLQSNKNIIKIYTVSGKKEASSFSVISLAYPDQYP